MVTSADNQTAWKILEAACQIVAQQGVAGLRVDGVAQVAGVNKRMIYHYFVDKEGLMRALFDWQMDVLEQAPQAFSVNSFKLLQGLLQQRFVGVQGSYHKTGGWPPGAAADQVCRAVQILLPELVLQSSPDRRLDTDGGIPPAEIAQFAVEVIGLLFPQLGQQATRQQPGSTEFSQACKRLLTLSNSGVKPVYRMHSRTRPLT